MPGGGWPLGALTELLTDTSGIGELQLLLPALRTLAHQGRPIVWITPPYLPYAPALAQHGIPLQQVLLIQTMRQQESLWAIEQTLRCPAIGAVLGWGSQLPDRQLRRLQLAAETGSTLAILHRPLELARSPSPAALRVQLQPTPDGLALQILKYRGGRAGARVRLDHPDAVAVPAISNTGA